MPMLKQHSQLVSLQHKKPPYLQWIIELTQNRKQWIQSRVKHSKLQKQYSWLEDKVYQIGWSLCGATTTIVNGGKKSDKLKNSKMTTSLKIPHESTTKIHSNYKKNRDPRQEIIVDERILKQKEGTYRYWLKELVWGCIMRRNRITTDIYYQNEP